MGVNWQSEKWQAKFEEVAWREKHSQVRAVDVLKRNAYRATDSFEDNFFQTTFSNSDVGTGTNALNALHTRYLERVNRKTGTLWENSTKRQRGVSRRVQTFQKASAGTASKGPGRRERLSDEDIKNFTLGALSQRFSSFWFS